MNKLNDKNSNTDPEYGLDSSYPSNAEQETEATLLMESRLKRMKSLSKDNIIRTKLVQLKLKMEDYLKEPLNDTENHFTDFLKTYVDTIYTSRRKFAQDINITPIRLSQIINNHREPKDEFILKLMIHSEKVYGSICDFQKKIWYQVYFHKKICDTMSNQDKWRPGLEKDVKLSEPLK